MMVMSGATRRRLVVVFGSLLFVTTTYRLVSNTYSSKIAPATIAKNLQSASMFKAIVDANSSSSVESKIVIHSDIRKVSDKVPSRDSLPSVNKLHSSTVTNYDHFIDWPSAFPKQGCFPNYDLKDRTFSVVLFMADILDSLPIQTFLSVIQFSDQSNLTLSDLVVTYVTDTNSQPAHEAYLEEMQRLAGDSLTIVSTSAGSAWKAKLAAIELVHTEQVLVVDDTVIMNRHFLPPLLYTLEQNPRSIVTPHFDSFIPMRIYTIYMDKLMHPDAQIWQETKFAVYHVSHNMEMVMSERNNIQQLPPTMQSGGLNGEVFVGTKTYLTHVLSTMKTDEVAELSLLSYMCGAGVIGSKCAVAVRSNAYKLSAPKVNQQENLQRLYPFYDTNPDTRLQPCADIKQYYSAIHRFMPTLP